MKTTNIYIIIATAAALALFAGCNTVNPVDQELTEEEIELTGEIVGESLSGERGGLMSTMYDAFSTVSQDGISYGQVSETGGALLSENSVNRSSESEWSAEYNPETGEHIISFRRSFEGPFVSKSLSVLNKYIFTDPDGEFLEFPRRDQDLIETIDFKGMKSGSVESARKSSSFSRVDTLFTSGLYSESPILSMDGSHDGEGEMTVQLREADGTAERSYKVRLNLIDVQLDKEVVQTNGTLEEGVTGLITYTVELQGSSNGQSREKTISGTIEMTGDGTALLRFDRIQKVLRLGLRSGEVNQ
ncbi:hypothetical protein [Rhodohalobacter mucosus]|uniref:Uncharacterized protein n=1 Tax=Rhodohalobacter mucosus TaxID=2079485 RepID=A0A316TSV5_9BACT|nr:hypothetical protein [Rhodohalobacter mucosus]PWN07703.1 hypothetical protein DDZ15_01385 [Rhodohalobacter mucosus]